MEIVIFLIGAVVTGWLALVGGLSFSVMTNDNYTDRHRNNTAILWLLVTIIITMLGGIATVALVRHLQGGLL